MMYPWWGDAQSEFSRCQLEIRVEYRIWQVKPPRGMRWGAIREGNDCAPGDFSVVAAGQVHRSWGRVAGEGENFIMETELLTTNRKALTVNLDLEKYGTFAEIGAGQEVARYFFQAGGAAGTVAKSISAYDMTFSDEIYGKSARYVSKERLLLMLDHEYKLLQERLETKRGGETEFFVFADTVAARSFRGNTECHGWMGMRFQTRPMSPPNDIIIHVRMLDDENLQQQQALGVIGTNLVYGAFYYHEEPQKFIQSLLDNLNSKRIEVDMVEFKGPDFAGVDNRLLALQLVQHGLTNAVMFGARGEILQPSEVLHKKAILVERGSFRPVTLVNTDMMSSALSQFVQEPEVQGHDIVSLMEITMHNLLASGEIDHEDFLARVDTMSAIGNTVLISNYSEYYRLTSYFRRYTKEMIGVVMGINNLLEIFNEKYYDNLEGGILESFGRMFRNEVKLYIYPMRNDAYDRYVAQLEDSPVPDAGALTSQILITARNVRIPLRLQSLYAHLLENHFIEPLFGFEEAHMHIFSRDVLAKIKARDGSWEEMVPGDAAVVIKERGLFGYVREGVTGSV